MVEDAKHMDAQARMCACQMRLHFVPSYETLPQAPLREMTARHALPDPLGRPRLPLASDPAPPWLLGIGTATPGDIFLSYDYVAVCYYY